MMRLMISSLLILFQARLYAEVNHLHATYSNTETSDEIIVNTQTLKWKNNRRKFVYPYPNSKSKALDIGVDLLNNHGRSQSIEFKGQRLLATSAYKFSNEFLVGLKAGFHDLSSDTGQTKSKNFSMVPVFLHAEYKQQEALYTAVNFSSDFAYVNQLMPKGVDEGLKQHKLTNHILYTGIKRLRIQNRLTLSKLSDNNKKIQDDIEAKMQLGPKDLWLWLGLGAEYYRYSENITGYWTPRRFILIGPRIELAVNAWKDLFIYHATNLNRFFDENSQYGNGYYTVSALQIGRRENANLRIGYEGILSRQNSSSWKSNKFFVNGNFFY